MLLRKKILITCLVIVALFGVIFLIYPTPIEQHIRGAILTAQDVASSTGISNIKILSATDNNSDLTIAGVIADTNHERQLQGLGSLKENNLLDQAAELKLQDMFTQQYFEHVSPQGVGPGDLAQKVGYSYIVEGENLAMGIFKDDADLVAAWMASPGHRANILNSRFTEIGVAVGKGLYNGKETWMAIQEFGAPSSVCPSINAALKSRVDQEQTQLTSLTNELNTIKQQLDSMPQNTQHDRDAYNAEVNLYNSLVTQYTNLNTQVHKDIDEYNQEVKAFNACLNA